MEHIFLFPGHHTSVSWVNCFANIQVVTILNTIGSTIFSFNIHSVSISGEDNLFKFT